MQAAQGITSSNKNIQEILDAEHEADKILKAANEYRISKLKEAVEAATQEVTKVREAEEKSLIEHQEAASRPNVNELKADLETHIRLLQKQSLEREPELTTFLSELITDVSMSLDPVRKKFISMGISEKKAF